MNAVGQSLQKQHQIYSFDCHYCGFHTHRAKDLSTNLLNWNTIFVNGLNYVEVMSDDESQYVRIFAIASGFALVISVAVITTFNDCKVVIPAP